MIVFLFLILLVDTSIFSQALARGLDPVPYYEEESGGLGIIYLFIWAVVCGAIGFLYRLRDKINKADEDTSKKVYEAVILGSFAGAIYGFAITVGLVISAMLIDWVTDEAFFSLSSVILQKPNLLVCFFASVNVSSIVHVLRNVDHVLIRTEKMVVYYRDE